MKKNAFLLPILTLAVALVGCKPTTEDNSDTGSDDVAGSAGKSLVRKMVVTAAYTDTVYDEEYDGSATLNFAYDEGRLASITGTGEFVYRYMDYSEPPLNPESKAEEGVWMEDKTSGTATVGFAYDGENVNVSLSLDATYDEEGYGPEHASGTGTMALQMNADKAVSSARSKFVSEGEYSDEFLVNFEYADNFLTRVAVPYEGMDASYGLEFGWESGNIVRVGSYDDAYLNKKSPARGRVNGETDLGTAMTRLMFPLCGILSSSRTTIWNTRAMRTRPMWILLRWLGRFLGVLWILRNFWGSSVLPGQWARICRNPCMRMMSTSRMDAGITVVWSMF